jgi:hypothetical protein
VTLSSTREIFAIYWHDNTGQGMSPTPGSPGDWKMRFDAETRRKTRRRTLRVKT